MIPYGKQEITQQDIDVVVDVLTSDFLTQGPQVPLFEKAIKDAVNSEYALAVNSATSALHIACLALGVGKGDVVWTTPITFVASANCALYCGADVDFVDIDPETYNLSPELLEQKLAYAKHNNLALPKVVIPVHLCGQPCEMDKIHALSIEYGFAIIEDASHAIGGRYKDNPIGNCEYSDITVFSFHPVKIVTTAEGGAATTNEKNLARKLELLRSHGVTRDNSLMHNESHGGWYYEQVDLGFNYRMTEMQAALGVSQMSRLHDFVAKRNELAACYDDLLKSLPLITPKQINDSYSGRHLYVIRLKLDKISLSHKEVFDQLRENGIGVNLHYIPVHTQPYYKNLGFEDGQFPIAESYYKDAISIPLFHVMTNEQQYEVINVLSKVLAEA
jgi:UDP-4-amino-4,6-dideoxy-N-acetyl-beta-L-altrosamine transaminase